MQKKSIATVGSLNADVFFQVHAMPAKGETLQAGDQVTRTFGGKGANQAVAAAKLIKNPDQLSSAMLGQVGNDEAGASYLKYLSGLNIDATGVARREDCVSGQAYIFSHPDGDNSILIVGAANQAMPSQAQLDAWKTII